jgi:20S proteasome alpha/beta subunit
VTLILGGRCRDGVVLVADSKLTEDRIDGLHFSYDNKITGEIEGILTAFSGDRGMFEVFTTRLRDYVNTTTQNQIRETFRKAIIGFIKPQFGPTIDQLSLGIYNIQHDLHIKNLNYNFDVLMGVSGKYYAPSESRLFYFYPDGRVLPIKDFRVIGSGAPFVLYYLKRYWEEAKMEMKKFAQLADFAIKYVEREMWKLDNAVGLNPARPFPQIIYIPDNPDYCRPHNQGKPKSDCSPNEHELIEFSLYSDKKLISLECEPFFGETY